MKKSCPNTLLALFCIFFSMLAQATIRDGLYFGAGAGVSYDQYNLSTNYAISGITATNDSNENNVLGNVFIGYGYTTPSAFFVGGELGGYFPNHSATLQHRFDLNLPVSHVNDTLTIHSAVTLDLLPGYAVTDNLLLYGRTGLSYGNVSLHQSSAYLFKDFTQEENLWGGRFGLGGTFALSNNLGLSVDYFYTAYQNMSFYKTPYHTQFTANPSSDYVGLSILYRV
jgi:outer membrane immunogenic protein